MLNNTFEFEKPIEELESLIVSLKSPEGRAKAEVEGIALDEAIGPLEAQLQLVKEQIYNNLSAWEKTQMARHKDRPYSLDYIRIIFDEFLELSGDRLASDDEAVVGGLAVLNGESVVVIGQQKGRDLRERQKRNFGSARAEGFRKALRLAKMAEKFGLPLISFVDTAGAAADLRAEEHGVSEAIARNLRDFALLKSPIVVTVIGEGGSGGALGMAVGDRVLMLEHSIYSVISPEGCAAILWRDKAKADEAAQALNLTAEGAKKNGLIDQILPEPLGGAHKDVVAMAATLKAAITEYVTELKNIEPEKLVEQRYKRIRGFGQYGEN
ncbi:MAG: acetyl-CoA carboxylase carboxyltransferase subunit alpha [Chthonomonadales bacterium]